MTELITMGDLGERRILREIIPQYVAAAGSDCASIGLLSGHVVITTDPVPPPAAMVIGNDPDLYWLGWLLVTINASDIAASGAEPLAFVAALEMPSTLPIPYFHRLLGGIKDSCTANGLTYVGGNLREADKIAGVGTAIGISVRPPLTRHGACPGDLVLVIGEGGRFWADVERIKIGQSVDPTCSPLFAPVSQSAAMRRLHSDGLLRCAMDTSDGLAPTLVELALINSLGMRISLDSMAASHLGICDRPERLWMGWGDWTIVAVVDPKNICAVQSLLETLSVPTTTIGEFVSGGGVTLATTSSEAPIGRLESERFTSDSWFSKGIEEYRRLLLSFPLPHR